MTDTANPLGEVTVLLRALGDGDQAAFDRLLPLVYGELRRMARGQLRRHASTPTLDATGLVHDAYLKMVRQAGLEARDRGHFLAIAARAMRQILVDRSRRRTADKRGGEATPMSLDEAPEIAAADDRLVLDVDEALARLPERLARVVECRFFAGLSETETAEALGASLRTVQRDWKRARVWLREELQGQRGESGEAPEGAI